MMSHMQGHVIGHMSSHSHVLVEIRVQIMWYFPRVMCSELKFVTLTVMLFGAFGQ